MSLRAAAVVAALMCLAGPGFAREPTVRVPALRDKEAGLSPARERQRRCGMEWRGLGPAERAAQGPGWPAFYSRCVKRLKGPKT